MKNSSEAAVSPRSAPVALVAERDDDVNAILDSLRAIVRELRLASREAEQHVGIHGAQLYALRQLADSPSASLSELADRTHTDISSASVVVSRLVEQGLVTRRAANDDKRRLSLSLTARGRAVVRRAPKTGASRLLRAASNLSDREVHALATRLGKLAEGLARQSDD